MQNYNSKLKNNPLISIIIRTKNEEKTIEKLLKKLRDQTVADIEIIIVDNDSKDHTLAIAKKYNVDQVIHISDEDFSHPYSTNVGVEATTADYVVLTNGHCIPLSKTWLEDGLENFKDMKVAGIDGHYYGGPNGTVWQKAEDKRLHKVKQKRLEGEHISTTNTMIRRDLWEAYPFDESLPECEDYDWSQEMKVRGYKIVKDPRFNVVHHHPLTEEQWKLRVKKWDTICEMIDKRRRPHKQ